MIAVLFPLRRPWVAYLAVASALALAYLFAHGTPLHSGPVFNLLGFSSVAVIALAARSGAGRVRAPWLLIAAGQTAFVVGDVIAYNYERLFGSELPFPSVADPFYLATYPLLMGGLLLFIRRRTPSEDRAGLLDSLTVTTAAGVVSWALLIAPYAHDESLTLATKLTSVAYPVMDLAVLAGVIRLAVGRGRREPSFYLLLGAILSLFTTDSIYGWLLLHDGYETGGLLDAGWIVFYLLTACAALHPSAASLAEPTPDTRFRLTYGRILTVAVCSLTGPVWLILNVVAGDTSDTVLLASASAVGFSLVVVRLLDLVTRHADALRRATVLATAGGKLVEASTRSEIVAAAEEAVRSMLGVRATVATRFDAPTESGDGAGGFDHVGGTAVVPLRGRTVVRGTMCVSAGRPLDADTYESIRAVATEAALALDGVALSEDLLKRRADARFESLVQHSSDVVLVVDAAARIEYASPSTDRILGYRPDALTGRDFAELLPDRERARVVHAVFGEMSRSKHLVVEFEFETPRGRIEVEATCTNLVDDENVGGVVLNIRDVSERKTFERRLAHQAFHDEVTGLANRALFRDRVQHALERRERTHASISILFADLDDFKTVNDSLGHAAGDALLAQLGKRIEATLRASDTPARLGGDEFAVLLEDRDPLAVGAVAERLLAAISAPVEVDGQQFVIRASVGIAHADDRHESVDALLRNADVAMYTAKEAGKNVYRVFEPEMHAAVLERLELKRALQIALDRGEFELHYQPIVDLESEATVSIEALLRWRHPERGLISPAMFVPLAEETGLIVPLGRWVLETACVEGRRLLELIGDGAPSISVNLSARQLQHPELLDDVENILRTSRLPAEKLILEITESVMIADIDLALLRLDELKRRGVRLAVDDFGSGYSSLNYIRRFPIDILKVDRSFIADVGTPGEVSSLTETMIELAAILGVVPVAEGIEDRAQLERLREMHCQLGQGFLFSKPLPAGSVEAMLLAATPPEPRHGLA
ncbi:MAG: EAL domain-containing protein [Actinomycetota bacterium]|nr:EAL domain-containing protein [Actinomycetota bacterium]